MNRAAYDTDYTEGVQDINKDNRHAECFDCHDPHQAQAGLHESNFRGGPQVGIKGVSVINGVPGITPNLFTVITPIVYEYQLCFKCHSAFTDLVDKPIGDIDYKPKDKAKELNPNNPSYHPVQALGKNLGIKDEAFALGTKFNPTIKDEPDYGLTANYNSSGVKLDPNYDGKITCSDCHGNDDENGAQGPHGSNNRKILRKPFNYKVDDKTACMDNCHRLQAVDNNGNVDPDGNALCFKCHSKDVYYGGASGSRFLLNVGGGPFDDDQSKAPNDSGHALHTNVSEMAGKTSCFACHQPHGSGEDYALIRKISPDWKYGDDEVGVIDYQRNQTGGSCMSSCHRHKVPSDPSYAEFTYILAYPRVDADSLGSEMTYEESASQINYVGSWLSAQDSLASGSGYMLAANSMANNKASATFEFSGTEVNWLGKFGPEGALADVYIDDTLEATIDTTAIIDSWQIVFSKNNLEVGQHTIKIELKYRTEANVAGTSAQDQKLILDAFITK